MSTYREGENALGPHLNASYRFILPMILSSIDEVSYVKGCYIYDKNYPEFDNHVFIVLNRVESREFKHYCDNLTYHSNYIGSHDGELGTKYKILVFSIPEDYRREYYLFKDGRFSKFSESYKQRVLRFHKINPKDETHTLMYIKRVLYKEEPYRKIIEARLDVKIPEDQELHSIPDIQEESCC